VADEQLDGTDMIGELFGEGQRLRSLSESL
jgi:hypothetical protein